MASSKFNKNDYLINTTDNIVYFVVKKAINTIILRREYDDNLEELPIHFINSFFRATDLETALMLYPEENKVQKEEDKIKIIDRTTKGEENDTI